MFSRSKQPKPKRRQDSFFSSKSTASFFLLITHYCGKFLVSSISIKITLRGRGGGSQDPVKSDRAIDELIQHWTFDILKKLKGSCHD